MRMTLWVSALALSVVGASSAVAVGPSKSFNVKDFGAAGDGVHDDTPAILAAIKAAGDAGGGKVVLPPSKEPYVITDTIRIGASRVHVVGAGATLFLKDGAGRGRTDPDSFLHIVYVAGTPQAPIEDVTVEGVTIDANFWGQGGTGGGWQASAAVAGHPRGLRAEHVRRLLVDKVTIRRAFVGLTFGLGCFDCEARDTTVTLWHHDAFGASPNVDGGSKNIRFIRCRAVDAPHGRQGGLPGNRIKGWEIEDGVHDVRLEDCLVANAGGTGFMVRLHGADGQLVKNVEFLRCRVVNVPEQGWFIRGWRHGCHLRDVRLIDCKSDSPVAILMGAEDVKIIGGEFKTRMMLGYYIDLPSNMPTGPHYKRLPARSVTIRGAAVEQIFINTRKGNDDVQEYLPKIVLEDVTTTKGISVLSANGTRPTLRTVNVAGESVLSMKNCRFGTKDMAWQEFGRRAYDPVPTLPQRAMAVRRCAEAPKIDGAGEDDCWSKAGRAQIAQFLWGLERREGRSVLRACYDDRALYLLFQFREPDMGRLRLTGTKRDDDVWFDDSVEVLVRRGADPPDYSRQWVINAAGVLYDADTKNGGNNIAWNSAAEVAAKRMSDRYVIEVAIPWRDLGGVPQKGETCKANFLRYTAFEAKRWIWSWQFSNYKSYRRASTMGTLTFE